MPTVRPIALLAATAVLAACASRPVPGVEGPFLWGVSVAGHQIEGGDRTSQWARWGRQGKTQHANPRGTDSYRRYAEDLDLAAGMGLSAYRFSIEWCRVEPRAGKFDRGAIEHYRRVARAARARGMTPIITLFHFAYPAWLDDPDAQGRRGWERVDAAGLFARYVGETVGAFKAEKALWIPINEPTIFSWFGYHLALWPPGKRDKWALLRVLDNLLEGHGKAYAEIHRLLPGARVGFSNFAAPMRLSHVAEPYAQAGEPLLGFRETAPAHPDLWLLRFLQPGLAKQMDFAALDYYFPATAGRLQFTPPWEWPVYPRGLFEAVREYACFFQKPVLVAENGLATRDGAPRADGWTREAYLVAHVREIQRARTSGLPVLGYSHWSLLDNYEWGSFEPRFGLYQVNYGDEDLTRIPTPAVSYYRDIAQHDGVRPELEALISGARADAALQASPSPKAPDAALQASPSPKAPDAALQASPSPKVPEEAPQASPSPKGPEEAPQASPSAKTAVPAATGS